VLILKEPYLLLIPEFIRLLFVTNHLIILSPAREISLSAGDVAKSWEHPELSLEHHKNHNIKGIAENG
jgi:hypothetical protein